MMRRMSWLFISRLVKWWEDCLDCLYRDWWNDEKNVLTVYIETGEIMRRFHWLFISRLVKWWEECLHCFYRDWWNDEKNVLTVYIETGEMMRRMSWLFISRLVKWWEDCHELNWLHEYGWTGNKTRIFCFSIPLFGSLCNVVSIFLSIYTICNDRRWPESSERRVSRYSLQWIK